MSYKVLCVDDDQNILSAYRRNIRGSFMIETALGPEEGLRLLAEKGPFAVVVSDLKMPGMTGIEFLSKVRSAAPATVRIMLTGFADLEQTIQAVNEGYLFRFLTKPCPVDVLSKVILQGIEQYRLVTAERELLEKTLTGSIRMLTEVLSLASPASFGRASRVRRLAVSVAKSMGVAGSWQVEIAAMLSQLGCISVPDDVIDRSLTGKALSAEERAMLAAHPKVGADLLALIPRLEAISGIVLNQGRHFDGGGFPQSGAAGESLPLESRILHVVLDYDLLANQGKSTPDALHELRQHAAHYDPRVLHALEEVFAKEIAALPREMMFAALKPGMVIAEDVVTSTGMLLVPRGQEVSESMLLRLQNFSRTWGGLHEPLKVYVHE